MTNIQEAPQPIIVGYTLAERADAREDLQLADFGAETDKTNEKRRLKFEAAMHEVKLLGHIVRIVAVDCTRKKFLDTDTVKCEPDFAKEGFRNAAHAFAAWLLKNHEADINKNIRGGNDLVFYGFDLKPMFRILGPECNVDARFVVPLGLWFQNEDCWDPGDMLVEADYRLQLPLPKILRRVGMRLREGYVKHADALTDCTLAGEMAYRFGLVADKSREQLGEMLKAQLDNAGDNEKLVTPAVAEEKAKKPAKKKG